MLIIEEAAHLCAICVRACAEKEMQQRKRQFLLTVWKEEEMKEKQEHEYCSVGIMLGGKDQLKEGMLPRM